MWKSLNKIERYFSFPFPLSKLWNSKTTFRNLLSNWYCFKEKELSFCHKLKFSNLYIFATKCRRPLIFQTVISVRSYNISLKYQRFTPFCCIEMRGLENCNNSVPFVQKMFFNIIRKPYPLPPHLMCNMPFPIHNSIFYPLIGLTTVRTRKLWT